MSFGITDAGFVLKTFDDILEELNEQAQLPEFFGPDVDLSEFGEVGILSQLMAKALGDTWEDFEDLYFSMFVDTSEGVSLDRVVALDGLSRRPATKALVNISASGTVGTSVPLGFKTQNPQGIQFETIASGTITATGVSIESRAVVGGTSGVVPANTIIEIVNPVAGITDVNNPLASTGGLEVEEDFELRNRFEEQSISGGSSVPAIINALLNIENVITANVNENNTDVTDGEGLPPHSIQCIVSGSATDTEIAETIFNTKAAGIETFGSNSKSVLDINGDAHLIRWDEPTDKFVNVIVNITINSAWVASNVQAVKTATIEAIGGVDTIAGIAIEYAGIGIGADVQSFLPITKFDNISGIDSVVVLIAFAPTTPVSSATLVIASSESARVDTDNVTVNPT
jgi:uncharacterized phage protein gp47/JayE